MVIKNISRYALVALGTVCIFQHSGLAADKVSQNDTPVPLAVIQVPDDDQFSRYSFVVDKEQRLLTVWESVKGQLNRIAEYPTDIGKKDGNKFKGGDSKTPEGIYFLTEKMLGSQLDFNLYGSMAFASDYPNFFDRFLGKTGSGIWLHAIPDTVALTRGSRGCVVVRNNVIKELDQYIKIGHTPLMIFDKVPTADAKTYASIRKDSVDFLEKWRQAWETQNIDAYIGNYDKNFKAMGMTVDKWKEYKTSLKNKYEFVKVQLSAPAVYAHNDDYVIRFLQSYSSNLFNDYGEKTLYLKKVGATFKIIGEEFSALKIPKQVGLSQ
jgi:murein L,D-transpeptidase YafK